MITLQQLQSIFPQQHLHQLHQAADANQLQQQIQAANSAVNGSPQGPGSTGTPQQQQIKTIYASPPQMQPQQQVINLQNLQGIPQQFIQLKQDGAMPQQQFIQLKQDGLPQQFIQGGQIIQNPNGMFQVVQPIQTMTVDGQEAFFIPNMQNTQFPGQAVNIGGQQAFITPNGQIVRAPQGIMPGNFMHNMTQAVQLPNGEQILLNF